MLQGILSFIGCARVRGQQLASWRYSYQMCALYTRDFSTTTTTTDRGGGGGGGGGGGRSGDPGSVERIMSTQLVDQSFIATHSVADGRRFEFATVVVRAMNKGRSPLNVWQQACSLIGSSSPPTFAVAFVSKPTESAKHAIQDFAHQLAVRSEPLSKARIQNSESRGLVEASRISLSHDSPQQSLSAPSEFRASGGAGVTDVNFDGQNTDIPPLIGCIMDDMGDFESSEAGQSESLSFQTQRGSSPRTSNLGTRRERAFGFDRTLFDDDEDEATLSDWEGVCTEYLEEANNGEVKLSGKENDHHEHEEEEPTVESSSVNYKEEVSKEGLVSFLNALTKPPQNLSEETGFIGHDDILDTSSKNKAIMQNRKVDDGALSHGLLVSEIGHHLLPKGNPVEEGMVSKEVVSMHGGLGGDGGASSPIEIWTGGAKPSGGTEAEVDSCDEDYRLVLCVGHMPGAKAFAFHSSTTGLPRLPDLEEAVTVNNPHMLLLGAPGFVFPDFIQRLSSVFPLSCRLQSRCLSSAVVH